ncbi:YfeK family protein [Cronobacter dublinensis]|uniref:YfeK family protein n=1 Tax=Cronobacter dublinensis TaxID=413497 RepID=UPI000CFBE458|nr:YfeK family protein [Cronobacter dublinensis]
MMKVNALLLLLCTLFTAPLFAKLNAHEEARIAAMLSALGEKKDLTFIRNGSSHNSEEAVSHLQLKLSKTRNRLDTAEQFIDKVASTSSISGQAYIVRINGKEETAQVFLHQLIAETDKTVKP